MRFCLSRTPSRTTFWLLFEGKKSRPGDRRTTFLVTVPQLSTWGAPLASSRHGTVTGLQSFIPVSSAFQATAKTSKERAYDYVGPVDTGLCCCVCHDPFDDPVLLECGHSFCRVCVDNWLATQLTCPECRSSIREDARRPTVLALKRLVDDLPVRCPSTGCGAEVTRGNLGNETR